jgi:hypothetical protein
MKDRSTNETANRSHSVASEVAVSETRSKPSYQIDDRRAASVMQRKFRNLANGLASANIIQQKINPPNLESKVKPFTQNSKESE